MILKLKNKKIIEITEEQRDDYLEHCKELLKSLEREKSKRLRMIKENYEEGLNNLEISFKNKVEEWERKNKEILARDEEYFNNKMKDLKETIKKLEESKND